MSQHAICQNPACQNPNANPGHCQSCGAKWTVDPLKERASNSTPRDINIRPHGCPVDREVCQNPQCAVVTVCGGPCHMCGASWRKVVAEEEKETPAPPSEVSTEPAPAVAEDPVY